jgi:hypothetical protein
MGLYDTRVHRDGSVTYWSVYRQTWVRTHVLPPDQEMAALGARDRRRIEKHIAAFRAAVKASPCLCCEARGISHGSGEGPQGENK